MPRSDDVDDPPPVREHESEEMEDDILDFGDGIVTKCYEQSAQELKRFWSRE